MLVGSNRVKVYLLYAPEQLEEVGQDRAQTLERG